MKKIQKIKSLNKVIHFPSPSVSFSYPKHRGSFKLKSKQKSLPLKRKITATATASATRTFTATTAQRLDLSYLIGTTPASTATTTSTSTATAYPRLLDLSYLNLIRVSNINSKNSEIPFNQLAKNKRKVSKNLVKKIQKIKSLHKAIHFLSPSDSSFSFSFSSVSYPKHRGSLMPKSKEKSFFGQKTFGQKTAKPLVLDRVCYCFHCCYEDVHCFYHCSVKIHYIEEQDIKPHGHRDGQRDDHRYEDVHCYCFCYYYDDVHCFCYYEKYHRALKAEEL